MSLSRKKYRIFVGASDPGSANALMPVIDQCFKYGYGIKGIVSGSAGNILGKRWPEIAEIDDSFPAEKILNIWEGNRPDIVLAGAGAYNLLEHTVRHAAADAGIPCIAVLDYWTNYHQRFYRMDGTQRSYSFPDRICVLDEIVRDEMLKDGFAPEQVIVTGQPYFEYIMNWKKNLSAEDIAIFRRRFLDKESILIGFCSEPIVEDMISEDELGYTQYTTIKEVASILGRFAELSGRHMHLVVRPHPREHEEQLKETLMQIQTSPMFTWEISRIGSSLDFIVSCDLLIGMTSMAVMEAYIMSCPVLSVQLNLKKNDVFFGTTRGYCPSIYNTRELDKWFEKWLLEPALSTKNIMPFISGATDRIITIMNELADSGNKTIVRNF